LPLLAEGSKGIDKLSNDAHRYGGVLSDETIKAADQADKAMRDAEKAFGGVVATLTADLLPVATNVFKTFSGWVASNRGEIKQWASSAATWITGTGIPALKNIATEVGSFTSKVLHLVGGAAKLVGGFDNLAIAVAALRLAPLALTLGKIATESIKAAAGLLKFATANRDAAASGGGPAAATGGGGAPGVGGTLLNSLPLIGQGIAAERAVKAAQDQVDVGNGIKFGDISNTSGYGIDKAKLTALLVQRAQAAREAAMPRTGAAGGTQVNINAPVTVQDNTRQSISQGFDTPKQKALTEYDQRVSFAE
jgi:hypothetical protein